ncbi:hypothetical protein PLICRDRAFT_120210, partial [Plicaturopsis crispa FD-325 SS-3]
RDVMRGMMLVNVSGVKGHAMPTDINMEHKIGNIKELLKLKGITSSWDRLGDIGATVNLLATIKKQMRTSLGTRYRGISHTDPSTHDLVWKIANYSRENELQKFQRHRTDNLQNKLVPDALDLGTRRLISSTLASFNKQRRSLLTGAAVPDDEGEQDEGPSAEVGMDHTMVASEDE